MRRTRAATAAATLLAVTLLALAAGCTADGSYRPPIALTTESTPPPAAIGPEDTTCLPRRSFAPMATLPAPGKMPAGSAMADIQQRGRLILGTSQDTLLFSSRNPFSGKVEGFDVDMGRQIAQAIFGDPNKIQIKVIGYADRTKAVADGRVDLVADTMTMTCARWREVDFSTVYYQAGQKVLVSSGSSAKRIEDLKGKRVCTAAGSTSAETLDKLRESVGLTVVREPGFADCLVAFQLNQADAVSTDDTILVGLAAQDPYAKVVGPRFTDEPYGIAMKKEAPGLAAFVNAVLARNRADGTWKATYAKWLGDFGPAPAPPKAEYR